MFKIIYSSTLLILDLVICLHQEVEINIKTKKKIQQIKNIVNNNGFYLLYHKEKHLRIGYPSLNSKIIIENRSHLNFQKLFRFSAI